MMERESGGREDEVKEEGADGAREREVGSGRSLDRQAGRQAGRRLIYIPNARAV